MAIPVCPADKVVVKINRKFQNSIGDTGLVLDTRMREHEHVTLYGTVVSLPPILKRQPDISSIKPELQVGDEVYFSYSVIYEQEQTQTESYHVNEFQHEGETYWLVEYSDVFYAKRNGQILMIGGWVLVEPAYEKIGEWWDNGTVKERLDKGRVIAIGSPKDGQPELDVKAGDIIRFDERFVQQYHFHGIKDSKLLIVKQERVLAKHG